MAETRAKTTGWARAAKRNEYSFRFDAPRASLILKVVFNSLAPSMRPADAVDKRMRAPRAAVYRVLRSTAIARRPKPVRASGAEGERVSDRGRSRCGASAVGPFVPAGQWRGRAGGRRNPSAWAAAVWRPWTR